MKKDVELIIKSIRKWLKDNPESFRWDEVEDNVKYLIAELEHAQREIVNLQDSVADHTEYMESDQEEINELMKENASLKIKLQHVVECARRSEEMLYKSADTIRNLMNLLNGYQQEKGLKVIKEIYEVISKSEKSRQAIEESKK